jgi:hypothetical protein
MQEVIESCLYNPMPCRHDCLDCEMGIPVKKKHWLKQFINFIQMHFEAYDIDNLNRLCKCKYITRWQRDRLKKWRKL